MLIFEIYSVFHMTFLACYSASYCKNLLKSDDRLLTYVEKRFQRWQPSAILNFKSFNFWLFDCHQVQYMLQYTKFHQNPIIFQ